MRLRHVTRLGGCLLAAFVLLPVYAYLTHEASVVARVLVASAVVLATFHPASALLCLAGLIPFVSVTVGALVDSQTYPGEALLLATLAGWLLNASFRPTASSRDQVTPSALAWLFLVICSASVVVRLVAIQPHIDYPAPFVRALFTFFARDYFVNRDTFDVVTSASVALESLGLFIGTATIVRRTPGLAVRALTMIVAAAFGVAALNISRLAMAALRTGSFVDAIDRLLPTVRISSAFPDFNAAGSFFALMIPLVVGIAGATWRAIDGVRRWLCTIVVALGLPVLLMATWLTGSRSAVVATGCAFALVAAWRVRRRGIILVAMGAAAALIVLSVWAASWMNPPESTGRSLNQSAAVRLEMAKAALRMTADHPLFGVGLGAFHAESNQYIAPAYRTVVARENAHNNFLQILAELGLVGFVVFCWLVVGSLVSASQATKDDPTAVGATAGLVAFGITCLTGHPLLILEVSSTFWLVLGCTVGFGGTREAPAAGTSRLSRIRQVGLAVAAVLVLISVPFRGDRAIAEANLQSATIGLSEWQLDPAGIAFRRLLKPAQFFVPSDTTYIGLPVRLEQPTARSLVLEVRVDGKLANCVPIEGSEWRTIGVPLPLGHTERRFRPIQVGLTDSDGRPVAIGSIWLAKPQLVRFGG